MLGSLLRWRGDRIKDGTGHDTAMVTLSSDDGDVTRAINIMRVMGLTLNATAMSMVPHAAMAIEAYRKLDEAARQGEA